MFELLFFALMLEGEAQSVMPRLLSLLLLFAAIASAQPPESHSRITLNVQNRDYAAAIAELRSVEGRNTEAFRLNNYDYLLARLCERTGDLACAAANYAGAANRDSVLCSYALWHLSHLARSAGNLAAERVYLMQLLAERPDSLLTDSAERRLAKSWYDSDNYELAIKELNRGGGGKTPPDRAEQVLLAKAHFYSNDAATARSIFASLINSGANPAQPDDNALEAARGLDLLDVGAEKFGKSVAELSDYEHLRRAQIYQFNRDFPAARLHFAAIVERHPASGIVPDAIFQIGRGLAQSSDFAEAVKWFERAMERFPEHPIAKDALLQLASGYTRLGRHRESVSRYERYIALHPQDERVDRAYLNIVDVLRDAGEETDALTWAAKTQDAFRGKPAETQALFTQARIRMARSDWPNALVDLEKLSNLPNLGGPNAPGGTTREEINFLRAYVLEQLRRFPEAIEVYLSVPEGRNEYYGWRVTERLRALATNSDAAAAIQQKRDELGKANPKTPDERRRGLQSAIRIAAPENRAALLVELRKVYESISAYRTPSPAKAAEPTRDRSIGSALAFLGLYDEAAAEIEAVAAASPDASYSLAVAYLKGDRADRAAAFIEKQVRFPSDFQVELLPARFAEMLYPAPYSDELLREAPGRGLDPRFLLAIMRQESRFRPNVKSNAAARGLMQFISTTADRIAADLKIEAFEQDELFDPPTAIRFGSKYVGDLFAMFPAQPEAVGASYNGGEDNMRRWMNRSRSAEADRCVPEILFAQSKDYVHRVMANYRMYTLLYDERLKRKISSPYRLRL